MLWTYFWLWFPMLLLAVLNGAAREMLYKASLGELHAHQLSTVTLLILFSVYIWLVIRIWPPDSSQHALLVGLLWLVLTLAFEFGFGAFGGRADLGRTCWGIQSPGWPRVGIHTGLGGCCSIHFLPPAEIAYAALH